MVQVVYSLLDSLVDFLLSSEGCCRVACLDLGLGENERRGLCFDGDSVGQWMDRVPPRRLRHLQAVQIATSVHCSRSGYRGAVAVEIVIVVECRC
jgi:hypothetical protein